MLPDVEILRFLTHIRYSSTAARNARKAISINAIAEAAGITRAAIYAMLKTGSIGPSRARLSAAIERVNETCQTELGGKPRFPSC
jgi:predicted DNA-binding transcriptional regulator AlpA